jgi:hypothetical protein
MTALLVFEHRGFPMALPANQAVTVEPEERDHGTAIALWEGQDGCDTHTLQVRTASGVVTLSCHRPRMEQLAFTSLLTLSPLLRENLREMPYIVGAAWVGQIATWLVDMTRFPAPNGPRIALESARRDDDGH